MTHPWECDFGRVYLVYIYFHACLYLDNLGLFCCIPCYMSDLNQARFTPRADFWYFVGTGYVATPSSFSRPNDSEVHYGTSDTAAHVHTLARVSLATAANGNAVFTEQHMVAPHPAGEAGRRFYTPPTKETSQSYRVSASPSSSSSARRWVCVCVCTKPAIFDYHPVVFSCNSPVSNAYRSCTVRTFCNQA